MKTISISIALVAIFLLTGNSEAWAQNYRTGVGLRAGYPFGLTVKHFMTSSSAVEVIAGGRSRGFEAVALYEYNFYPAKRKEFDLYLGGGGHVGVYRHYRHNPFFEDRPRDPDPFIGIGVDAIVGCSWTFTRAPLNLGVDYKPAIVFYRYFGYFYGDFAFSIRYAFGSESDRSGNTNNDSGNTNNDLDKK